MKMKITLVALALAGLVLSAWAAEKPEAAKPPPEPIRLIADFRAGAAELDSYGSWQGKISPSASGVIVLGSKGADGKGGLGHAVSPTLDLSQEVFVEVALGVGAGNGVPTVTIAFSDTNETQYTATVNVDQIVPQQPVWLRVRLTDFKLNNWQNKNATAKIDWTHIVHWDLQGDWVTATPLHIVFIALRTRH